jgi:hypothetical protein
LGKNQGLAANPDLQDFGINMIIKNDVKKSRKSLNQVNQGSDNGKHHGKMDNAHTPRRTNPSHNEQSTS